MSLISPLISKSTGAPPSERQENLSQKERELPPLKSGLSDVNGGSVDYKKG
jgi:hypothetical protein